jgi:2-polyprenyl-3-methyl-5-hydroxy-6-metoxy-1,4-benzoquinol methylase
MKCRFCSNKVETVFIDLDNSPPSNSYLFKHQLNEPEVYFPLKIFVCDHCFLVQVDEYKKATEIFDSNYAYFSSQSTSWLAHSKRYVEKMVNDFGINDSSTVFEIASNDGYLLQYFKQKNVNVLGIEPTASTAKVAREKGIESIEEFFGVALATQLNSQNRTADLILGNNVLAHVPDINDFVGGLKICLKPEGIITMEFPHLLNLVEYNQFDTIYHEHFSYLSLFTVKQIFEKQGLEIFHVEELTTHGGSLRVFAKHSHDVSHPTNKSVEVLIEKEIAFGINRHEFYLNFDKKVEKVKIEFLDFLIQAKKTNKKVAAYGAAAKGNTLLNYCGVKSDLIDFVVDLAPSKQGKYLPGSHIEVVNESVLKENKPDYIIIFPWNIKDEIVSQLAYARDWGCKFVVAIPNLEIF